MDNNNKETALVGNIQKFSTEDGPGIRTTVFLKGCPLKCRWCHNPEMIDPGQQLIQAPSKCIKCGSCIKNCPQHCIEAVDGEIHIDRAKCDMCLECANGCYAKAINAVAKPMTVEEIMKIVAQDYDFYGDNGGMTLSGGEMLMHGDFAEKLIEAAAEKGINVCLDTSGFAAEELVMRLASKPNVTNILYDMKCIDDEKHKEYTGVSNERILSNLRKLAAVPELNAKIQMRMPLIKGVNDSDEIIEKTIEFYKENGLTKVTLLEYHTLGVGKSRNIGEVPHEFESPGEERLLSIKESMEKEGIEVELVGSLNEPASE
ncbi:MAG: glycyl-radical enzyme activating protein [Bacillota bacterium]|nr:glycyl-radical enzyme activating protein [Bacillota bacterium]